MDECEHKWVANSGEGGEPVFKTNRHMAFMPTMHVKCSVCNDRTWMSLATWEQYVRNHVMRPRLPHGMGGNF